ncbi:hypothetical protein QYZ88_007320 [Lachnospiraceae bacterium C1.1]|nr:hypothetical protein [Lachnospiraceae bacterium C1.1]
MQDRHTLFRAEQSRAEQSRAEQSRAEQSRAEQSRAEQFPLTKFERRRWLALIKCACMARTNLVLRFQLALAKCSAQAEQSKVNCTLLRDKITYNDDEKPLDLTG